MNISAILTFWDFSGQRSGDNPWFNDASLVRAIPDNLDPEETKFWNQLISKYLYPLHLDDDYKHRMSIGLSNLRNKSCFAFFLLNGLFVLVVLLLQIKKDCLHVEWPFGPLINHTFIPCTAEDYAQMAVVEDKDQPILVLSRLQLEPIGFVFLIFFVSLLLMQVL